MTNISLVDLSANKLRSAYIRGIISVLILTILTLFYLLITDRITSVLAQTVNPIPRTSWSLKYVDSQETSCQNGAATNSFDGDNSTIWHTQWCTANPPPPHEIQINLGGTYNISGFQYLPRQDGSPNGRISQYEFYVSSDGVNWGTAVATGTFANDATQKSVSFTSKTGQYVRLRALSEVNGKPWTSMAEINILGSSASATTTSLSPPQQQEDTGTANAPTTPANTVIKTVCASGCDYTTIQAAINAASAGWTIQVKNGIYYNLSNAPVALIGWKNGTQQSPITLTAYPGHTPIIDCTNGGWQTANPTPTQLQIGINFNYSNWWIIDGFEIRGCGWWGVRGLYSNNITISNNHIHHNLSEGINFAFSSNIYIVDNEIDSNGLMPNGCPYYHRFCHGIYLSGDDTNNPNCTMKSVTVRRNYVHDHHGFGIHLWSGNSCNQVESNTLIENNLLVNNQYGGWEISKAYLGNRYRNNTVVLTNIPTPAAPSPYSEYSSLLQIQYATGASPQNQVYNNIFYAAQSSYNVSWYGRTILVLPLIVRDGFSAAASVLNNNLWRVTAGTLWIYTGNTQTDFNAQYKSLTGWDTNGILSDSLFMNLSGGDYHIQSGSPARNRGNNNQCSAFDLDYQTRPQEGVCDIGVYEYP